MRDAGVRISFNVCGACTVGRASPQERTYGASTAGVSRITLTLTLESLMNPGFRVAGNFGVEFFQMSA